MRADRIVLPGVGAFADCRRGLDAVPGMVAAMTEAVRDKAGRFSAYASACNCWQRGGLNTKSHRGSAGLTAMSRPSTRKAAPCAFRIWAGTRFARAAAHPLLAGVPTGEEGLHAYFVHSYAFKPAAEDCIVAVTDYGGPIAALIATGNIAGTQFHPEKSQALGLSLIANFLKWKP